jgi:uncharacterized membrane protein
VLKRSPIEVRLTTWDTLLHGLAWLALAGLWGGVLFTYPDLPEMIPAHYNSLGQVDRYDNRSTVFIMVGIATLLFGGIALLERYPHALNYPAPITEENAERQYRLAIRLLRISRLGISLLFAYLYYKTYRVATGEIAGLGPWFLPACILGTTLVLLVYLLSSRKAQ